MSRFIKNAIPIPEGVSVDIKDSSVQIKGPFGVVERDFADKRLRIEKTEEGIRVSPVQSGDTDCLGLAGSYWSILNGMVSGVKVGVERILDLVGVGYRAQLSGDQVVLQLGFSHPVHYTLPKGVTATMPTQTEIILKGVDKALLGQSAADIRAFRPPEPYKGKGVRYRGEHIQIKETKKK